MEIWWGGLMGLPSSNLLQFENWKITVLSRQISTKWATSHSYVELPEAKPDEIVNYFSRISLFLAMFILFLGVGLLFVVQYNSCHNQSTGLVLGVSHSPIWNQGPNHMGPFLSLGSHTPKLRHLRAEPGCIGFTLTWWNNFGEYVIGCHQIMPLYLLYNWSVW